MILSARDAVDELGDKWNPAKVGDHTFVLQYELTDPLPGDLDRVFCVFLNGVPMLFEGQYPVAADLTFTMPAQDFVDMTNRQYDIPKGIRIGRMKVKGSLRLAGVLYRAW